MNKTVVWIFLVALTVGITGTGCSSKSELREFDRPALYWYQKILSKIASGNLEKADNYYTSLESEHISSPLIPQAMLMLFQAHMDNEEYLLADFYLQEYMKRYGSFKQRELAEYFRIKAAFYGLHSPQRDQKLIDDTIRKTRRYIQKYPDGELTPMVYTMQTRLVMTRMLLNEKIAALYGRRDKPRAAAIYRQRNQIAWLSMKNDIQPPDRGWFGWLFE